MGVAAKPCATVSIRLVWPFLTLARERGREVSGWVAARLGVSVSQLEDPETRVSLRLVARLLDEAVERRGERDIGLLAAQYVDAAHFGIGEYIARTRATLGAAIEDTGRYLPLLGDGAGHAIERKGRRVIVRFWFSPELAMPDAAYEFATAIAVLRARRITGVERLSPLSVHFMHGRPESTVRHEQIFRCPVRFQADVTHVVLSTKALQMPLAGTEPELAELLSGQANSMLEHLPQDSDIASQVSKLLGGGVDLRSASVSQVASRLGLSVRTLKRRLREEGTSFRALVDAVRKQIALRELTHGQLPIATIADRLGFASSQSFQRAFRRWTGTSPKRVRTRKR